MPKRRVYVTTRRTGSAEVYDVCCRYGRGQSRCCALVAFRGADGRHTECKSEGGREVAMGLLLLLLLEMRVLVRERC